MKPITRKWFYYFRDENRHPVITVCLVKDEDGKYHRGMTVRSFSEKDINKPKGRGLAYSRALAALNDTFDERTNMVQRMEAIDVILSVVDLEGNPTLPVQENRLYKCTRDATLSEFEVFMIEKKNVKEKIA